MVDILIDYKYGNKYQFENDQEFLESMNYYRRELNIWLFPSFSDCVCLIQNSN